MSTLEKASEVDAKDIKVRPFFCLQSVFTLVSVVCVQYKARSSYKSHKSRSRSRSPTKKSKSKSKSRSRSRSPKPQQAEEDEWETYDGDVRYDNRHGQGQATYPNGSIYDGAWLYGLRHGKGKWTDGDGTV